MAILIRQAQSSDSQAMAFAVRGRKVAKKLDDLLPLSLVAEVDGEVVGFLAFHGMKLHGLYVRSSRRGEGIGSALLDRVEGQIRESGKYGVQLDVEARNKRARQLYASRSYLEVTRSGEPGHRLITMEKQFRQPSCDERAI
jgi:ribosomal protein S18 acetylase RimI-like enzyme